MNSKCRIYFVYQGSYVIYVVFVFFYNCLDLLPKILNHCFNVCIHLCFNSKQ